MIDSVYGFLQVSNDTTGKAVIVKSISYHFCEAYESIMSKKIILKTKVIEEQYFLFLEEVSYNWICIDFLYNLHILDKREIGV